MISETQKSNLLTMQICSEKDSRQNIGSPYSIPNEDVRRLRAQLILEETLETIEGLGLHLHYMGTEEEINSPLSMKHLSFHSGPYLQPNLEKIIDGCIDVNYVTTGTLCVCGVPDMPHSTEVNEANLRKFPNGEATFNEKGKYQKPANWVGPNHKAVQDKTEGKTLQQIAVDLVDEFRGMP